MRAFTLMEVIVYIALFSILTSGLVTAANTIRVTAGRNDTRALMLEEGTFLLETLAHAAETGTLDDYAVSDDALVRNSSSGAQAVSGNQVRVREFTRTQITSREDGGPFWMISITLVAGEPDGTPYTQTFSEDIYTFAP